MWHPQLDALADEFRVLALDLPGHGAQADVPFRLADASDAVESVITAAGGRAIVVGISLGAYVAMNLAATNSDRVAGLVLANASTEPRSVARRAPRTVGAYLLTAASERIRGRAATVAGGDPPLDASGAEGAVDAQADPATNGWLFKGGTRAMVTALGETFMPRLAAYPGPSLLVNGEDDRLFRHDEAAFLAAARHGRLEVIPGCGHRVSEDQPAAFNAAVRRFAAEVFGLDGATRPD